MKETIHQSAEKSDMAKGHIAAILTIILWGTTFISTKLLLVELQPIEILLYRFVLGFLALLIAFPKRLRKTTWKQEALFALAGLFGICLYFLFENIALTFTLASNVGVIISAAPFFTVLISMLFAKKEEKAGAGFFIGFVLAMSGIALISFHGSGIEIHPVGELLAILAALVWACYSVITKKISSFGHPTILMTRRVFLYGILFVLPVFAFSKHTMRPEIFLQPGIVFNLLFLGLGASAVCFVTWGFAVRLLGAVKTTVYIYMVPVVTIITSAIILHEKLTLPAMAGTALTLLGLFISSKKITLPSVKIIKKIAESSSDESGS